MEKFKAIEKPYGMQVEQDAYVLDGGSIAGESGCILQCQVMMLVHPDFEPNAKALREKIEKFFDKEFLSVLQ